MREALIGSQKIINPARFHREFTRDLSVVEKYNEVNRFIDWSIYSLMNKLKKKDNLNNQKYRQLLSMMLLQAREMDNEYVGKYYDIIVE